MDVSLDRLATLFLTELSQLDSFAAEREGEFALDSGRDDPDVRRLIEAMAFFSARTRAGAVSAVEAAVRRLAAGTLDELLVPSPAAMMIQALPGDQLIEPVQLPTGLPLQVTTKDGRVGVFTTERALTLLPVEISEVVATRGPRRVDVTIKLLALRPLSQATTLCFYVRRLDDYRASLGLYAALERHFVRVRAESDLGELTCRFEFGARSPRQFGPEDEGGDAAPFAAIRSFFQLPEQELFLRVNVAAAPGGWSELSLQFELDEAFPEEFAFTVDTFQLGVVPCANRWFDFAQPLECDGTRLAYAVRSADAMLDGVELQTIRGVYRSAERGLIPIVPTALARLGDSFEFEAADSAHGDQIRLDIPDAFERPCRVQIDAAWSQPQLWSAPAGRVAILPRTRRLPGVTFRMLGPLHPAALSPLARDPSRCLDVLALKVRPALSRRDLIGLLELLGASGDSCYRGLPTLIDELESSQVTDPARRAGGIRRVYRMALRCRSADEEPLLQRMAQAASKLLDAWTEDAVDVEIVTRRQVPNRPALKESA